MARIIIWRLADDLVAGELRLEGGAAFADGAGVSVLETGRARGDSDASIYAAYSNWSNGVFCSREVESA